MAVTNYFNDQKACVPPCLMHSFSGLFKCLHTHKVQIICRNY